MRGEDQINWLRDLSRLPSIACRRSRSICRRCRPSRICPAEIRAPCDGCRLPGTTLGGRRLYRRHRPEPARAASADCTGHQNLGSGYIATVNLQDLVLQDVGVVIKVIWRERSRDLDKLRRDFGSSQLSKSEGRSSFAGDFEQAASVIARRLRASEPNLTLRPASPKSSSAPTLGVRSRITAFFASG